MDALDEVSEARVEGCDVSTARAAGAPHAVGALVVVPSTLQPSSPDAGGAGQRQRHRQAFVRAQVRLAGHVPEGFGHAADTARALGRR